MEKIYKRQKWLKLTQEKIENLKPLYLLKKLNSQLNLLTRKLISPDDATGEVYQIGKEGTSLVAQWLRIHLPMRGTRVWALVREDPTCCGAAGPVCHSSWSPRASTTEACMPGARAPQREGPLRWEACVPQRSPQLERACAQQRGPDTAK